MTAELAFPAPEASDPEDVAWNLQTGGTMWARGDSHEAVRWLRRAAEAASDAGSDMRAVNLARAAADLTAALELPPSIVPPPPAPAPAPAPAPVPPAAAPAAQASPSQAATTPTPVPVSARPMPPPVTPLSQDEATTPRPMPVSRPKAPPLSAPDEATVLDYALPANVAAHERRQPPPSRRPPRSSPSAAPPPPLRSSPSAAPPPLRSSPGAEAPPTASSPQAAPPPPSRGSVSAVPQSNAPATSRSSPSAAPGPMGIRPRQALRVAVTPSSDDKNLLLVRPLADDEALPAGAHEALLAALEPGVHLTSKKR